MLELYYYFFHEFCENDKYEEMEMDTDSLYLALAETNLYDCISEDKKEVWEFLRSEDCDDDFAADSCCSFSTHMLRKAQETRQERTGSFQGGVPVTEMLCLCSKTYCCYDAKSNKYTFSSKGLNKRTFEDSGDGPMAKYQEVLTEQENVTSTNRGFRAKDRSIATYEQTKKGLSYFYPKRIVEQDGIHKLPLNI